MLADQFDLFLIDLDGVVYLGDDILPQAREALQQLRAMHKSVRFLTNDPRPTREEVAERLARMHIQVSLTEVITSGHATAAYLQWHELRSAYVVGSRGLASEVQRAGVMVVDNGLPDAVVIGCDEQVSYEQIARATTRIHAGARFIATNADGAFPMPEGPQPATGAIVAAVQAASGQQPEVVGKPGAALFTAALAEVESGKRVVMIGDSVETDILGAHKQGLSAILVADQRYQPKSGADFRAPDATISDLAGLFAPGVAARSWEQPRFRWPDRLEAGVSGFVFNAAGQMLLMKRADNGLWAIPSGRVEAGETVADAIVREVLEETGLQVEVLNLVGVYSDPIFESFTFPDGLTHQFVFATFRCRVVQGEVRADGVEALDARFFNVDDLPPDRIPMHPRWLSDALSHEPRAFIR